MSLEKVRQTFSFPTCLCPFGKPVSLSFSLSIIYLVQSSCGFRDVGNAKEADTSLYLTFGSDYQIADFHFLCSGDAGHSAEVSIVFPEDHLVLSGDALFRETDDLPTERGTVTLAVSRRTRPLPSSYTVYPGHGPGFLWSESVQSLLGAILKDHVSSFCPNKRYKKKQV